jgi:hypothetical protein
MSMDNRMDKFSINNDNQKLSESDSDKEAI